jgi:hypothetical protein
MTNVISQIKSTAETANQPSTGSSLFCIAHDLSPLKTPIANRANKILGQLQKSWQISILTATKDAHLSTVANINYAKNWYPKSLIRLLNKLKLTKLLNLLIWPDPDIFWFLPALFCWFSGGGSQMAHRSTFSPQLG